jgi:hypothetical protein
MGFARLPAGADPRAKRRGNREAFEQCIRLHHVVDQRQRHAVQRQRRILEVVLDLCQREGVARPLFPVGFAAGRVEAEAQLAGAFAPVGTLGDAQAAQAQPPKLPRAAETWPKPARLSVTPCCGCRACGLTRTGPVPLPA